MTETAEPATGQEALEGSRSSGIQIFSTPSDAPRVRWRSDLISAGITTALLLFLILVAGEGSTLDTNTLEFIGTLPGWLLWLGQAAYIVGVLYSLTLLVGVGIFARGRLQLLRDMLLAAALSIVVAILLSRFIDERWPELAIFDLSDTRETFPAFIVSLATAIQAAASPHLTAPVRKIGWTFVLIAAAAAVLGGVTTVSDTLGGLMVGLIAAALVRYALGTSAGIPSLNRIRAGLADLGIGVDDLAYSDYQPPTTVVMVGTSEGEPIIVSILGRDAWSTRRWTQWWRHAWYHDEGEQHASDRRQQIEHQALTLVLAERAGVSVASVISVGMTGVDDALLVAGRPDHTLADLDSDEVDDATLDGIWNQLSELHQAGISQGSVDSRLIWFTSDGTPVLSGFSDSVIQASEAQKHEDAASMLVLTTLVVGSDRAIAAARRSLGDDELTAMLPVMQTAALGGQLRREVKQQKLKVKDLRKQTAEALDIDVPEVEQLTRVSWKSIVMTLFIGFAAYTVLGGLAEVGIDAILDAFRDARWGLVLIALVLVQATNYTDAFSTAAVSPKPIPIGITTIEQFAIGFVNMAVPSEAGRMATNARYFEKFGINVVTSTTTGAITSFVGFIAQAILVALTILVGKGSIDFSEMEIDGGVLRILATLVIVLLAVGIIVALVPKWRHWALDKIRKPLSQVGTALKMVKDPKTAIKTLGGAMGTEVLYAAGLSMCVLAVGGSVSLGEVIFINVTVSLFAGLMPIPGGVGVTEAGLTAGLSAVGVAEDTAVAAVLSYRMCSYYLPPIWGYFSLKWLTNRDYL